MLAIDLHDVTKTYRGRVQALRGVSLAVNEGEIFGLLGPNGAGKSTLVKIIMTVVRPTTIRGTVLGEPVGTQRVLERIGIAAALVNDPRLVVLDEPTDGVDPVGRREIRDMLLRIRAEGRTVLVNSHLLSEVEMVANRVAIINQGRTLAQGTIEELTRDSHRYEIDAVGGPERLHTVAGPVAGAESGDQPGLRTYSIPTREPTDVQPAIDSLRAMGAVVVRVERARETLEDLFVRSVVDERGRAMPGAARAAAPEPPIAAAPPAPAPARRPPTEFNP